MTLWTFLRPFATFLVHERIGPALMIPKTRVVSPTTLAAEFSASLKIGWSGGSTWTSIAMATSVVAPRSLTDTPPPEGPDGTVSGAVATVAAGDARPAVVCAAGDSVSGLDGISASTSGVDGAAASATGTRTTTAFFFFAFLRRMLGGGGAETGSARRSDRGTPARARAFFNLGRP